MCQRDATGGNTSCFSCRRGASLRMLLWCSLPGDRLEIFLGREIFCKKGVSLWTKSITRAPQLKFRNEEVKITSNQKHERHPSKAQPQPKESLAWPTAPNTNHCCSLIACPFSDSRRRCFVKQGPSSRTGNGLAGGAHQAEPSTLPQER